eukprot:scaffold48224_cov26-Tisochrysis_lutea.AAC.3
MPPSPGRAYVRMKCRARAKGAHPRTAPGRCVHLLEHLKKAEVRGGEGSPDAKTRKVAAPQAPDAYPSASSACCGQSREMRI